MNVFKNKGRCLIGRICLPMIVFTLAFLFLSHGQADEPRDFICGDADGEGNVNISDAVFILNYVFAGGSAPVPYEAGDANEDETVNVADAVYILNYIFAGGMEPCPVTYGELLSWGDCKPYEMKSYDPVMPQNHDCLAYSYNGQSILSLKHINTCFNCCPDEVYGDVYVIGNLIRIVEDEYFEIGVGCPCLCLYDLDFKISNLPPGTYTIRFENLYLTPGDYLESTVDLIANPIDTVCVERTDYPWVY